MWAHAPIQPGARPAVPARDDGVWRRAPLRIDGGQAAAGQRAYEGQPRPSPDPEPRGSRPERASPHAQALGAITKGDRRAADASDLSAFDVDTRWGQKALDSLLQTVTSGTAHQEPPDEHVRQALDIRLKDLRQGWEAYLSDAARAPPPLRFHRRS